MEDNNGSNLDDLRAAFQALDDSENQRKERPEQIGIQDTRREGRKRLWLLAQYAILIICTAIVIYQIPKLVPTFGHGERPLRDGTYATDKRTDECIDNLWKISGLLQKGEPIMDDILDPASNKPYVVTKTRDDVIVSSPRPELYGLKVLRVSKKHPVPRVTK